MLPPQAFATAKTQLPTAFPLESALAAKVSQPRVLWGRVENRKVLQYNSKSAARRGGTFLFGQAHDPEKWAPVFGKGHAQTKNVRRKSQTVSSHLLPTYARVDLAFERGEGAWLFTADGERYLDFTSGVAVNALGHSHPHLVEAVTEQAKKVWHVSNLYRIPEGERLADRLCQASFADTVFFQNSGAEALECAIKMARKYQSASGNPERYRIVTFEGAFHGRTLTTIAATGNKKYLEGFGPPVEGFDQVAFGDLAAVKKAIGPETAAILIEPIQGEGGVRVAAPAFLRG
ncbi:MAG: aminotransferase class III-fold pyridoxal phosphate-dependent enzyme, partial [Croceibacterium sp.]